MSVFTRINKRAIRWDTLFDNGMIGPPTASGTKVDEKSSLKFSAVYAAVTLIADSIAFLTPEAFTTNAMGETKPAIVPRWVVSPHPEMRRDEVWSQLMVSALLWGNGYAMLLRRDSDGQIIGMIPLRPSDVTCEWDPNKRGYRRYRINGGKWLTSGDIFHVMGPSLPGEPTGMSVIRQAREAIGLGLTLEEFGARYFGQGSMAKVVIKIPGKTIGEAQAKEIVQTYERFHKGAGNWHRPAVLSGPAGTDIENISIPPEDAQFLQSREFQAVDIARWFRVPPHRIGIISKQSSWGSGLAEENLAFHQQAVRPWLRRFEAAHTAYVAGGEDRGLRIRLSDAELLRGTFKEQVAAWAAAVTGQIAVPNEARKAIGLDPIEGGDKLVQPQQPQQQPGQGGPQGQRFNHHHDSHGRFSSAGSVSSGEADSLYDRTVSEGGFTYSTTEKREITSGYAVSPYPERSHEIPFADFKADDIKAYASSNRDLLKQQDHMLGGWHDRENDSVWLDVSIVKSNQLEAVAVAQQHNQKAIFHLDNFEEIATGGTGSAA